MAKPVERQNHSLSFFILSTLIAICTGWSFYDEFLGRRPWKDYQERIFAHEREKVTADLRYYQRKIDSGEIKVALDPKQPDATVTVSEAKKTLKELAEKLGAHARTLRDLDERIHEGKLEVDEADLNVKLLKSEDDGQFYLFQHAQHEEMLERAAALKLKEAGDAQGAAAASRRADQHAREVEKVAREREELHRKIAEREKVLAEKEAAHARLVEERKALRGEHDRVKAAIEAAEDPYLTARQQLESALGKRTELTQYWLTSYDNSVDRCQNCHATIDRCGFSRPHEVVEAMARDGADPAKVAAEYCVNPDMAEHYRAVHEDICQVTFDEAASAAGKIEAGQCFTDGRPRLAEFLRNYCGERAPAVRVLHDQQLPAACIGEEGWQKLAAYVESPEKRGACSLDLKPEGEVCVEGAQRDGLLTWLTRHCPEVSSTLKGLKASEKACASGEQGKVLAATRPVLFELENWAQTHPYRMELLGTRHPPDRFGCTTCHEGQGSQTKGVAGRPFQHGYDDHYWEKPMLDLVAHKKFRPKTWGPPPASEGVPGTWVTHQDHFVESTCAKCHTEEVHLPFAESYARGRRLVAEIGCHGCHPVDTFRDFPKTGPTLTDLKRKTTPAFLMTWIAYPKAFRPRTKMPNFWPEALDEKMEVKVGTHEAVTREDEVRKIAAYLWKSSSADTLPAPPPGSADRGKVLVQQVGCRACHNFAPPSRLCTPEQVAAGESRGTATEPGKCEVPRSLSASDARDFAPNLSNIALKTNERWLYAWLKDPSSMWAGSRMPDLRLTDQEAADITAYLMTLREGPALGEHQFFEDEQSEAFLRAAEEGSKLITRYGCAGCHDIAGHESDPKIGVDLNDYGRKTVDLLDFGNAIPNPRHHTWFNFVDLKLRAPRAYRYERVETRMPQFDVTDDEVVSIMTFLKSRTGDRVPASYLITSNERKTAAAHGDQVMEYFNCRGCHVIDGQGGTIRDIYAEDDLFRAPPVLQQQGWRVQPEWLFSFLHDPSEKLRPWLDVRMPTFPLGDDRATRLVRGFSASASVPYPYMTVQLPRRSAAEMAEAKALFEELRCMSCHIVGKMRDDQDPASAAPNLALASQRLRPDWVLGWLWNPQSLQEGTRMPSFFQADDKAGQPYPKYFGGDQTKQIEALRDYVYSLGAGGGTQTAGR
jgi:cytochrome c551/c552